MTVKYARQKIQYFNFSKLQTNLDNLNYCINVNAVKGGSKRTYKFRPYKYRVQTFLFDDISILNVVL